MVRLHAKFGRLGKGRPKNTPNRSTKIQKYHFCRKQRNHLTIFPHSMDMQHLRSEVFGAELRQISQTGCKTPWQSHIRYLSIPSTGGKWVHVSGNFYLSFGERKAYQSPPRSFCQTVVSFDVCLWHWHRFPISERFTISDSMSCLHHFQSTLHRSATIDPEKNLHTTEVYCSSS